MGKAGKLLVCAAGMKIIVGLGNPGVEYQMTRHNAGIMLVERLAFSLKTLRERRSGGYGWRKNYDALVYKTSEMILVKTKDVFMNESGRIIRELGIRNQELWVAHDDLDIKLGEYKVQRGRGPKVHNGVKSVEDALGTKDFWRVRIGINNRTNQELRITGEDYVLQRFTREEKEVLDRVLNEIIEANFGRPHFA